MHVHVNPEMSIVFSKIDNLRKIIIKYDLKEYLGIDIQIEVIEVIDFEF